MAPVAVGDDVLAGRVAIVTGAGRGLGRAHAHRLAALGAAVVVNDLDTGLGGDGGGGPAADVVVEEIRAAGGRAVASSHDVADWQQAAELVELAVASFGGLHVLVNNAGILRDRTLAKLEAEEWDAVIAVHLRGHAATTHHAFAWWRQRAAATGSAVAASVIHTSSPIVLAPNIGQAAYAAAKHGIVGLSAVAALEGRRAGIRSNVVLPSARTRMATEGTPGAAELLRAPDDPGAFDPWDPANVSPLVGWLALADCPATGQVFQVLGQRVRVVAGHAPAAEVVPDSAHWTEAGLGRALTDRLLDQPDLMQFIDLDTEVPA